MSFARWLSKLKVIPGHKLLELYPPFLFMGVKITHISDDARKVVVRLPLRWYARNIHGTMFGGFMCAVSDPIPALMCSRQFPGTEVWTKAHYVRFRRPGKGALELRVEISDEDVVAIREELERLGEATRTFRYAFHDRRGKIVAHVRNTVFLRKRAERHK
jgi:acyl-coenzyme A thioesterase PaaI-like protein